MYTATSTIITTWAPDVMNYIWDSVTGFFSTAGGNQFVIVIIIIFSVVLIIISGLKLILQPHKKLF